LTWNKIYLKDIGKSRISDGSEISSYSKVNSGTEIELQITNESMPISKATGNDPSLSAKDSNKFFQESEVTRNSVSNRKFTVTGVLDFNIAADKTTFSHLILAVRSPSVFAYNSDFTLNDENPVTSDYNDLDNKNFDTNKFVYVTINAFNPSRESTNHNIVDYTLELEYTQEWFYGSSWCFFKIHWISRR